MVNLLFYIIFTFPIIDGFVNLINNGLAGIVYKIVLIVLIFIFQYVCTSRKFLKELLIGDISIILLIYIGLSRENTISYETQSLLNFILICILFSNEIMRRKFIDFCKNRDVLFKKIVYIYFFIIAVSILNGSGYEYYWGIISLKGPYEYNHTLAYMSLAFYSASSYYNGKNKEKKYTIFRILFSLIVVFTAVRSAVLALLPLVMYDFIKINLKNKLKYMIVFFICIIFISINTDFIKNNPITAKNLNTSRGGSISNGRDIFWKADMEFYFKSMNLNEKIFGVGMSKLKQINQLTVGLNIHAHNDYITIVVSYGAILLVIFTSYMITLCKFKNGVFMFLSLCALAATNGLFMYFPFVVCMPFLILQFNLGGIMDENKRNNECI